MKPKGGEEWSWEGGGGWRVNRSARSQSSFPANRSMTSMTAITTILHTRTHTHTHTQTYTHVHRCTTNTALWGNSYQVNNPILQQMCSYIWRQKHKHLTCSLHSFEDGGQFGFSQSEAIITQPPALLCYWPANILPAHAEGHGLFSSSTLFWLVDSVFKPYSPNQKDTALTAWIY